MTYELFPLRAESRWAQEKVGLTPTKLRRRWSLKHFIPCVLVPFLCSASPQLLWTLSSLCTYPPSCHIPISKVKAGLKTSFVDSWSSQWCFYHITVTKVICTLTFISDYEWKVLYPMKEISVTSDWLYEVYFGWSGPSCPWNSTL